MWKHHLVLFLVPFSLMAGAFIIGLATDWVARLALLLWNNFDVSLLTARYLAAATSFLPAIFVALLVLRYGTRRARIRETAAEFGLCPACGYDLTGNASGVCPECGRAVAGAMGDAGREDDR